MKTKKVKLFIMSCIICISAGAIYFANNQSLNAAKIESLRALYPTYDSNPPELDTNKEAFSIDELYKKSDLVITGQVVKLLGTYSAGITTIVGTPEYELSEKLKDFGKSTPKDEFVQYTIKVDDYVVNKNKITESEITVIDNNIFVNYSPQFKEGEKVLLFLSNGNGIHKGKYWTGKNAFFYVTTDNLVLSALSDDKVNKYSGMKVSDFKKIIKSFDSK